MQTNPLQPCKLIRCSQAILPAALNQLVERDACSQAGTNNDRHAPASRSSFVLCTSHLPPPTSHRPPPSAILGSHLTAHRPIFLLLTICFQISASSSRQAGMSEPFGSSSDIAQCPAAAGRHIRQLRCFLHHLVPSSLFDLHIHAISPLHAKPSNIHLTPPRETLEQANHAHTSLTPYSGAQWF